MQVSTYEITFPYSDNQHVLVNGLYGAVDIVSPEEAELLTKAKNDPSLLERLSQSRLDVLTERGHIVKDTEQEAQDARIISRIHTLLSSRTGVGIVVMPTYDCNLRCVYCYERHRLSRGQEWLEHRMTPSMLDSIFNQIKDFKARGYSVKSLSFYGGEPFLARNKDLVRDICERCRDNDMTIGAITNGCDFDQYIDLIKEFKISSIQITIDGVKEIHDRQRPFAGGGSSYDKIMGNIELAIENEINVSVRTNVTSKNISQIKALIDEFKSRGFFGKSCFSYYFKAADDNVNRVSEEDVLNELIRIGIPTEEAIDLESAYGYVERGFSSWLRKTSFPNLNPTHCGSENGMYVIDPYGKIFSCWDLVGKDGEEIGFVENGRFMYNFNMAKWHTRTSDRMPSCSKCPYLMLCGGGCAKTGIKHITEGRCENFKERFEFIAPFAIKNALNPKKPETQDKDEKKDEEAKPKVKSKYVDDPSCLSFSAREYLSEFTPEERQILMTTNSEREVADILKAH